MKFYILFGAGKYGQMLLHLVSKEKVAYFCDNNLCGQVIAGKKVISFEELKQIYQDYIVVLTVQHKPVVVPIAIQLHDAHIPYVFWEDIALEQVHADANTYMSANRRKSFDVDKTQEYPIFLDKIQSAGTINSYFWQDLWAARHIYQSAPNLHYDIGSRIDGFIAHLLSFHLNVRLLDIRPLPMALPGVDFLQCDATNLDEVANNSIESLSALCSLEHFGLGRYGDPIDPEACFKCFAAIQKKMKSGGYFYLSVPIGKEHVEYNAHRVFYATTIINAFNQMKLVEFSSAYKEQFSYHVDLHYYDNYVEHGGDLFGLFLFKKI